MYKIISWTTIGLKELVKMYRFKEKKLLPLVIRRVKVTISNDQHFVHGLSSSREIEFIGLAQNLAEIEVTIESGKMQVFTHDIMIGEIDIIRTQIPKRTPSIRVTLGYFNPILSAVNLPNSNTKWKLKIDNLVFSCSYGTWHLPRIESEYFEVISHEGWEKTIAYVRRAKQHPDDVGFKYPVLR